MSPATGTATLSGGAAPTSATGPGAATTPAPPASQIASAFMAVAVAPARGAGGAQQIVIRLDPAELGHVQVRIDRAADGQSHVVLAVERTDTLMLLLADRPHLNQALDAAGVPAEGRTLQFSLASNGGDGRGDYGRSGAGASGFGQSGSGQPGAGQSGFGQSGFNQSGQDDPRPRTQRLDPARTGVDITA